MNSQQTHDLIKTLTQHFLSRDDLQGACLAQWFVEQGTPEERALSVAPAALAHWANWEPDVVLEIVYRLLEEINYHTPLAQFKEIIEQQGAQDEARATLEAAVVHWPPTLREV